MISACGRDEPLLEEEDADHRQVVADAAMIGGTRVGAMRFDAAVGGVGLGEEG